MKTAADQNIPERLPDLIRHLSELRARFLWCIGALGVVTLAAYGIAEDVYGWLVTPLAQAMGQTGGTGRLIYTSLTEAFVTYLKVAFFVGVLVTLPFALLQIWRFVAPGLYVHEKNAAWPFLVATPVLFYAGAYLVYAVILPLTLPFFLSFQSEAAETVLPIQLEARVADYLDLTMTLMLAFGVCLQMPVVMALLARAGMLRAEQLVAFRRYAIVMVFVIAAVLTPPDVVSQIALAIPLVLLYEASILVVRLLNRHVHSA